jgi:hypothetical protein
MCDGTVQVTTDVAPFRFLEEDPAPTFASLHPMVGVRCLFKRNCIKTKTLSCDPIFHPNAEPKDTTPSDLRSDSYGDNNVRRALGTLIRLNAAPPFVPPR